MTHKTSRSTANTTFFASAAKENNFNFLRFLLAALVIASHSVSLRYHSQAAEVSFRLTHGQAASGDLAVDGFFAISGFLIIQSWLASRSMGEYLKKRALRIYPGYVVAALLCIFVVGPVAFGSASAYFHTMPWKQNLHMILFLNMLDLHPFTHLPVQMVNGSLWSISTEFLCYLIVAALGLAAAYRDRRFVLGLFTGVLALYVGKTWTGWETTYCLPLHLGGCVDNWPRVISFFLSGMVFYFYRERIPYHRRGLLLSLSVLLISCFTHSLALTLPIFGTYTLFYFAFHPAINLRKFGRKTDLSYGMYLYGWPVQQLLLLFGFRFLNPLLLTLAALPLSCGIAYLSWTLVEKPCLRLKRRTTPEQERQEPRVLRRTDLPVPAID